MTFNILDYRNVVEERLSRVSPTYRRCFAVWCFQGLWTVRREPFAQEAGKKGTEIVDRNVESFWRHVVAGTAPSTEQLAGIEDWCRDVPLEEASWLSGALGIQIVAALAAVARVFLTASPTDTMLVADAALNCIDAEIGDREGTGPTGDLSRFPEFAAELDRQRQMLEYLETSPLLAVEDLDRFR